MRRWNPRTSIFAGMPREQLQRALEALQVAYVDLTAGTKAVTASYTQGDGTKSVTYTAATLPNLVATIKELQAQLGIVRHARRAMQPLYR